MAHFKLTLAASLALAAVTLAGCGQAIGLLGAATGDLATQSATFGPGAQGPRPGAPGHRGPGGPGMGLPLADLGLTDDQQSQIKAIMEKHRPQPPAEGEAAGRAADKAVQAALAADTVDEAALRAALQGRQEAMAALVLPSPAGVMADVRAVLTAEQIAKVVAKLQAAPDRGGPGKPQGPEDGRAKFLEKLNLNAEQRAAFDALDAQLKAGFALHKPADAKAAMISFWQTGDQAALNAMQSKPPAFPIDTFVQAAALLDKDQRRALPGFGGHGRQRAGGPGGPGPKGPGGHRPGAPFFQ